MDRATFGSFNFSRQRFVDKLADICSKYENDDSKGVPQVVDIRNLKLITDHEDTDDETDQNQSEDFSESEEDYVESSYNDGRCSSSLASSNSSIRSLITSPHAVVEDKFAPTKGKQNPPKGNIVKLENADIFVDILSSAQLQKDQIMHQYLESSDDEELVGANGRGREKRLKYDEKIEKIVPKKARKEKKSSGFSCEDYLEEEPEFDVCFLEEPDHNSLKEEGIFVVDKRLWRNTIRNCASSVSSCCSFEADSLDSPINRATNFQSLKLKKKKFPG